MGGSGGAQTRMPIPRPLPLNFAIVTRDRSGNDRPYVRCASSEGNCIYIIDIKRDRSYCRTHAGASPPPAAAHHRLNPKNGGQQRSPQANPHRDPAPATAAGLAAAVGLGTGRVRSLRDRLGGECVCALWVYRPNQSPTEHCHAAATSTTNPSPTIGHGQGDSQAPLGKADRCGRRHPT
jgi:hypothetical protein